MVNPVKKLFCGAISPGLPRWEGMVLSEVLGLARGEIQLEFGPNFELAANPREILGTGFRNACASGQGRT